MAKQQARQTIETTVIGAVMWCVMLVQAMSLDPDDKQEHYVPRSKRSWHSSLSVTDIGCMIERGADFLQRNVRWLKSNRKTARFREIRTVAHRIARHGRDRTSVAATMALAVIMVMESRTPNQHSNTARFDTDATFIGVDNRCTACISDDMAHFVGKLTPGTKTIKGFHGSRTTWSVRQTCLKQIFRSSPQ
jgi:hypothetical protein